MTISLRQTTWYNQPAWIIENQFMRLITVPTMGAKIVSLYDKSAQYEWLRPPNGRPFVPVAYGASFTAQDMSGWDEMFPTIDSCVYPGSTSSAGVHLPDHGEVWALPWEVGASDSTSLCLTVVGKALPYRLSRTVNFTDEHTLQLNYKLYNESQEPLWALWAAHPQFVANEHTRILLPIDARSVINVQATPELGEVGRIYGWSRSVNDLGRPIAFDRLTTLTVGEYRKVYLPADQPVSSITLYQADRNIGLSLAWDIREIPYLGIWYDTGAFNSASTVALEPTNGYFDNLSYAWHEQRCLYIPPNSHEQWQLMISTKRI